MIDINILSQFSGTEHFYKTPFGLLFTDGVKYVADEAGAYWLIDLAASYAITLRQPFLVVQLDTNLEEATATATITDGNDKVLATQHIGFTDFPLESMTFWIEGRVIMLPSER